MNPESLEGWNCPLFLTIKYFGFITSLILWLLARISSTTDPTSIFSNNNFLSSECKGQSILKPDSMKIGKTRSRRQEGGEGRLQCVRQTEIVGK
jgi:hypothetical protein